MVFGTLRLPGCDDAIRWRISIRRCSTLMAHASVSRTSLDGNAAPPIQASRPSRCCGACCDCPWAAAAAGTVSLPTRSTSHPSDDTNRNATIVASKRGRARMGLLVRIFRRDLSLRVVGGRVRGCAARGLLLLLLLVEDVELVVEELVDVEEVEVGCRGREGEDVGVVTSQMIVFKITGVGRSEKPALKDIAICIKGRCQRESIAEVEIRRTWSCKKTVVAGCNCCCDIAIKDQGASADRHCRSSHNIAAGCCVASGEASRAEVATSAREVASVACSFSSSSGTGVSAGESEAGLTVLLETFDRISSSDLLWSSAAG
jgi:hypothetical protein